MRPLSVYLEITLFFVFWFHIDYFHSSFNYEVPGREDVQAAGDGQDVTDDDNDDNDDDDNRGPGPD